MPSSSSKSEIGVAPRSGHTPRAAWIPNQHGAWAMLLIPFFIGIRNAGFAPVHIPLFCTWIIGYLFFNAATMWVKSGRKRRFLRPVLSYGIAVAITGSAALILAPKLLIWAVVFAVPLAVALVAAIARRERTLVVSSMTTLASCLMTLVAADAGPKPDPHTLWPSAIATAAYFLGTLFYVRTMIRRRGQEHFYMLSILFHALCVVPAWLCAPWLGVFSIVAALRAAVLPGFKLRVTVVGAIETVLSILLLVGLLVAPPMPPTFLVH